MVLPPGASVADAAGAAGLRRDRQKPLCYLALVAIRPRGRGGDGAAQSAAGTVRRATNHNIGLLTMNSLTVKTRPTPRAEDTRRRIYDAALEMFREKGFELTTMRDIAAKA